MSAPGKTGVDVVNHNNICRLLFKGDYLMTGQTCWGNPKSEAVVQILVYNSTLGLKIVPPITCKVTLRNLKLTSGQGRDVTQIREGVIIYITCNIISAGKGKYIFDIIKVLFNVSKNLNKTKIPHTRDNPGLPKGPLEVSSPQLRGSAPQGGIQATQLFAGWRVGNDAASSRNRGARGPNKLMSIYINGKTNFGNGDPIVPLNIFKGSGLYCKLVRAFSTKAGRNVQRGSVEELSSKVINIKSIANLKNLVLAYESIKSKRGNMTPILDNVTLDGVNVKYLNNISDKLRSGRFSFSAGRKVLIPNPENREKRMVIIAPPREKIVQKAIEQVLQVYYDRTFNKTSFGYRPSIGIQDALLYVDSNFQSSR